MLSTVRGENNVSALLSNVLHLFLVLIESQTNIACNTFVSFQSFHLHLNIMILTFTFAFVFGPVLSTLPLTSMGAR